MMAQEPDRRARKKRATENAIEEAAVTLALAHGHAAVTVPAICDRADVSRSTFFNYMPTREAAIFGRPLQMLPHERARELLDPADARSSTTMLFTVVLASLPHAEINPVVAAGRARLLAEQPETQSIVLTQFGPIGTQLTALAAQWFAENPLRRVLSPADPVREASLTVSMVIAAFMAIITDVTGTSDVTLTIEEFERAIAEIGRIAAG